MGTDQIFVEWMKRGKPSQNVDYRFFSLLTWWCVFFPPKGLEQEWKFPNFWGTFENHPDNRHDVIKQVEKKNGFWRVRGAWGRGDSNSVFLSSPYFLGVLLIYRVVSVSECWAAHLHIHTPVLSWILSWDSSGPASTGTVSLLQEVLVDCLFYSQEFM